MLEVLQGIGNAFNILWDRLSNTESPFGVSWTIFFTGMVALAVVFEIFTSIFWTSKDRGE